MKSSRSDHGKIQEFKRDPGELMRMLDTGRDEARARRSKDEDHKTMRRTWKISERCSLKNLSLRSLQEVSEH